jgi:hypothetical protein
LQFFAKLAAPAPHAFHKGERMVALLGLILIRFGSIIAGSVLAFRRKVKWPAPLPGGFGLFCLAAAAIMMLALSHFGDAPRN